MEEGDILLIFDAANRYSRYAQVFFKKQAARLPKHSQWDHQIPLKDSNAKISARDHAIYKTTLGRKGSSKSTPGRDPASRKGTVK